MCVCKHVRYVRMCVCVHACMRACVIVCVWGGRGKRYGTCNTPSANSNSSLVPSDNSWPLDDHSLEHSHNEAEMLTLLSISCTRHYPDPIWAWRVVSQGQT